MKHHPQRNTRRGQQGSAIIVVMVLMAIMVALVVANSVMMGQLRQELRALDHQQQKKFEIVGKR